MASHSNPTLDAPVLANVDGRGIRSQSGVAVIVAAATWFIYAALSTASRGFCPGGMDSDGRFIDADGTPTDVELSCLNLTLRPSDLVMLLIAVTVIVGLVRAHRAATPARARVVLRIAVAVIVVMPLAAALAGHLWLWTYPLEDWRPGVAVTVPFPLDIEVQVTPLNG